MTEDKKTMEELEALREEKEQEAAALRERAKILIMKGKSSAKKMNEGLSLLKEALDGGDPEAAFIVGKLTLDGYLKPKNGNRQETAMKQLAYASEMGSLQASALLGELCRKRYEEDFQTIRDHTGAHPLVGFDGEEIKIDEGGNRVPIDAKLVFDGKKNELKFSLNLYFENMQIVKNPEQFRNAVIEGIKEWEGEKSNVFQNSERILRTRNSFATTGKKWRVSSKKTICIVQDEGEDNVFQKMKEKTKHEFGHVLGLGDLYQDLSQGLTGVERGEYLELDSFHIDKTIYQLVMCTSHGVISNNDIEMIILAFRENSMQVYQKQRGIQKVSEALGQGN